jgi:putative transposase
LIAEMTRSFGVRLHAYVLMDNHYHLLVELREENLSRAMQWLNVSYSIWFNRRHGRCGHLFQGRFKSVLVSPEEWALELSRYVHLNPVRVRRLGLSKTDRQRQGQGLDQTPDPVEIKERLEVLGAYRWSSYRAYAGRVDRPNWLECERVLSLGGGRPTERVAGYREYVESAVREGLPRQPWEALREQVILGGESFVDKVRSAVTGDPQEQRSASRLAQARPSLPSVIACVERIRGEKWEEFRDRHADLGRDLVLYLGRSVCAMKLSELAQGVGIKGYARVAMAIRRYAQQLTWNGVERERVQKAGELLNVKM